MDGFGCWKLSRSRGWNVEKDTQSDGFQLLCKLEDEDDS